MTPPMTPRVLVTVELRFITTRAEAEQLAERVRESASLIVGRETMEEFRWRWLPLEPPRQV